MKDIILGVKRVKSYIDEFVCITKITVFIMILYSCDNVYRIEGEDSFCNPVMLLKWEICGPLSESDDYCIIDSLLNKHINFHSIKPSAHDTHFMNSPFIPKYQQVDLKEFFIIEPNDTAITHGGEFTLMRCVIQSDNKVNLFLEVSHEMSILIWLNGHNLTNRTTGSPDIYSITLQKGYNELLLKVNMNSKSLALEALLCDSSSMVSRYVYRQSGKIIYPLINQNTKRVILTENYAKIINLPVSLKFIDAQGNEISNRHLTADSMEYYIPELKPEQSYMCELQIGEFTSRQPVCCGNVDKSYSRLVKQRHNLTNNQPQAVIIDQLLFRLQFLLSHPSRQDDWWWQFKIAPIIYQIDQIFFHMKHSHVPTYSDSNIKFVTYHSNLDNGTQRYLLATPNPSMLSRPLPLVIIIRPDIETHRHFFTCPQIARQWAINYLQELACRYNYIVMMAEMRTYLNEELSPMAEAELKLAIENVKQHYLIEDDRIFLHGNCSGAYRALQLCEANPTMFAAIALYAPVYDRGTVNNHKKHWLPKENLRNLHDMPIMIHYDPLDEHSPYYQFKDLIKDCKKEGIPLTISVKRNSGELYNVTLAGEEAFEFYKKNQKRISDSKDCYIYEKREALTIADFYAKPFLYIYHSADTTNNYKSVVDSIKSEYENYFFSALPVKADTAIAPNDIKNKNLFLIGDSFEGIQLNFLMRRLNFNQALSRIDDKTQIMHIFNNPLSKRHNIIVYHLASNGKSKHSIYKPWLLFSPNAQTTK